MIVHESCVWCGSDPPGADEIGRHVCEECGFEWTIENRKRGEQ